jgi:predicted kinase
MESEMRRMILTCVCAGLWSAATLSAQPSPRTVSAVRLTLQRVDQVALDFGVDTSAMRHQVIRRLGDVGITVANATDLPELVIQVRVPKRLAPVDAGLLLVHLELRDAESSPVQRTIWNDQSGDTRFTTYGSLRELVPERVARGLDALATAHASTETR